MTAEKLLSRPAASGTGGRCLASKLLGCPEVRSRGWGGEALTSVRPEVADLGPNRRV